MTQGEAQGPDPLVGQVVGGKFTIVQLLGEGGMGCVYLAEQKLGTSTRKVALKTLHKHLSHDESIKKRFNREVETVAALEHPNTIQVFDFGEMADGTLYLVMEFVQGKSVADILIAEGSMPPARVENILRQVCGSLEEAHNHGIVHRDLKPDNVVLCERAGQKDWVEVLDFGIAKRSSEHDPNEAKLTQQGMVLGTPPYMSPEQFTGQPVDKRSDIYALGVMAYEMLSGKLPWEANTAWEWASKHMTEPPQPLETQALGAHVPEKMRSAIARALAKNKEERFATVTDFFQAFAHGGGNTAVIGGSVTSVDPPVASGGPPRAKTEMAQPAMMGSAAMGGPGAGGTSAGFAATPPPYQAQPISNPNPVPMPLPPPNQAQAGGGGGGKGMIIGLAVVAVLFIGGGLTAYLVTKSPKHVAIDPTTTQTTTTTTPTESTSVATTDVPPTTDTVAPLGVTSAAVPKTSSGGVAPKADAGVKPIPTPTPSTAPTPTPTPPKGDPPGAAAICAKARNARSHNSPVAANLEQQCRAAGGTP